MPYICLYPTTYIYLWHKHLLQHDYRFILSSHITGHAVTYTDSYSNDLQSRGDPDLVVRTKLQTYYYLTWSHKLSLTTYTFNLCFFQLSYSPIFPLTRWQMQDNSTPLVGNHLHTVHKSPCAT